MTEGKPALNIEGAVALDPVEMIQYQAGSIIRRTLLQDETGTLTVFGFDEGQPLSENTGPYNAFISILDGEAESTIGGKPVLISAGKTVLMPGGLPHEVRAARRFKMLLTRFKAKTG